MIDWWLVSSILGSWCLGRKLPILCLFAELHLTYLWCWGLYKLAITCTLNRGILCRIKLYSGSGWTQFILASLSLIKTAMAIKSLYNSKSGTLLQNNHILRMWEERDIKISLNREWHGLAQLFPFGFFHTRHLILDGAPEASTLGSYKGGGRQCMAPCFVTSISHKRESSYFSLNSTQTFPLRI